MTSTSTPTPSASPAASAELLLTRSRPHEGRRLSRRELRVEGALAAAVAGACLLIALTLTRGRPFVPVEVAVWVLVYATAARVPLYVGGGCAMPTQLVLVPMLFVLPLGLVPLTVLAACVLAALVDVVRGESRERLLSATGDAGYAIAPVLVLVAAGIPAASPAAWAALLVAFGAQCGLDALLSIGREWLGRSIRPAVQLSVMARVYRVDALLLPAGALLAEHGAAMAAVLPLVLLLGAIARDRNRRLGEALDRLEDLSRERSRLREAFRRTGRSLASTLDREGMLDVALATAVDAVAATAGRATLGGGTYVETGVEPGGVTDRLLAEAAAAACATHATATVSRAGWSALAEPLCGREEPHGCAEGALAVCAPGGGFDADDQGVLAYLAVRAAASLDSIELHERLRSEATVDALTGLANRRRFHDVLELEVRRAERTGGPLSLVLLDVDDFKQVNDTHGHQCGDEVLRALGALLRASCRSGEEPARYGGEELGIVVSGADAATAHALAERLRHAIAALEIPAPAGPLYVTASFGVAELRPGDGTPDTLVAAADAALYRAKRTGKNRTAVGALEPAGHPTFG
jgi:diguanylate cyclase (GGDEF)-like protein